MTNPTNILFDTNLFEGTSDNFTVANPVTGDGTIKLSGLNILKDSVITQGDRTITLFNGGNSPAIDVSDFVAYTNENKYSVKNASTAGQLIVSQYTKDGPWKLFQDSDNSAYSFTENYTNKDSLLPQNDKGNVQVYGNTYDFDASDGIFAHYTGNTSFTLDGLGSATISEAAAGENSYAVLSADGTIRYYQVNIQNSLHGASGASALSVTGADSFAYIKNSVFTTNNLNAQTALNGGVLNLENGVIENSIFYGNSKDATGTIKGGAAYLSGGVVNSSVFSRIMLLFPMGWRRHFTSQAPEKSSILHSPKTRHSKAARFMLKTEM